MRPLYRLPDGLKPALSPDGHPGLWYDKFCDQWDGRWRMKASEGSSPKLEWIREVVDHTNRIDHAGSLKALRAYARRLFDLMHARGGEALAVTAKSRFVTGLGRGHPVENGFAWHPTLGTPYLPGSSVKGLTRAWAVENGVDKGVLARLLGRPDHAGAVAFLDAVPLDVVTLEPDVLTPHYANWMKGAPPGDWRSPTPVPFLVAKAGWSMMCGIVPLRSVEDGDMATVRGWLAAALGEEGAGAKTAVGYGRFLENPRHPTLEEWKRARDRCDAMSTPEGRWRLGLEGRSEEEILSVVRENLRDGSLPDPVEARALVRAILDTGMVTLWLSGQRQPGTNTGPKKLKEYARLVKDRAVEFGLE